MAILERKSEVALRARRRRLGTEGGVEDLADLAVGERLQGVEEDLLLAVLAFVAAIGRGEDDHFCAGRERIDPPHELRTLLGERGTVNQYEYIVGHAEHREDGITCQLDTATE